MDLFDDQQGNEDFATSHEEWLGISDLIKWSNKGVWFKPALEGRGRENGFRFLTCEFIADFVEICD